MANSDSGPRACPQPGAPLALRDIARLIGWGLDVRFRVRPRSEQPAYFVAFLGRKLFRSDGMQNERHE